MSEELQSVTGKSARRLRVSAPVDLVEVERLAALGMNQIQIAAGVGIGKSKWFKDKANNSDFADAYKRGQHKIRIKVLKRLEAAAAKNFAVPMFMSKQEHILGFSDQAMSVQHGGKLELVVRHEIMGAGGEQPAIDVTPGTIPGTKAVDHTKTISDNSDID